MPRVTGTDGKNITQYEVPLGRAGFKTVRVGSRNAGPISSTEWLHVVRTLETRNRYLEEKVKSTDQAKTREVDAAKKAGRQEALTQLMNVQQVLDVELGKFSAGEKATSTKKRRSVVEQEEGLSRRPSKRSKSNASSSGQ